MLTDDLGTLGTLVVSSAACSGPQIVTPRTGRRRPHKQPHIAVASLSAQARGVWLNVVSAFN